MSPPIQIRLARPSDIPVLRALIEDSVRRLQSSDYTPAQIEGALGNVLGLDTQLIADGHYFVAEVQPAAQGKKSALCVGCGGWSNRKTLFGSDHAANRADEHDELLDPATDAAKIRAIFVHPDHARRGIGTLILHHCEAAAAAAGFRRFEMGSTLTGTSLYRLKGYQDAGLLQVPLPNGELLPVLRMTKSL